MSGASSREDPRRIADLAELEATARRLGRRIGADLPKTVGFVVWLFEWGHEGWATYVSNAQRPDMIKALEELLAKLKGEGQIRPPIGGGQS
jgi:hypothetical protein